MKIKPSKFSEGADFSLVELKEQPKGTITPHCKKHGAMNKLSHNLWRCVSTYKVNEEGKFAGSDCDACCIEEKINNER